MADWRREAQAEEFTKAVLRSGASVAQDIIRAAEDANVDLIAIGNHGQRRTLAIPPGQHR